MSEKRSTPEEVLAKWDAEWSSQDANDLGEALRIAIEERDEARAALEFYANPLTYQLDEANGYILDAHIPIFEDEGKKARAALQKSDSGEGVG